MNNEDNNLPCHHGPAEHRGDHHENETIRLLYERASCRSFEDKDVSDDVLNSILKAGIHAPTGGNLQPYSIIKIRDDAVRKKLGKMCGQEFIGEAPVNLLFCLDWHRLGRWAELESAPYTAPDSFIHFWIGFQDVVIAAQNICTAVDALGLGSVYIGTIFDFIDDTRKMFDLPKGVLPVVLLSLGYPKHRPEPRKKLGLDMIVHDEKYRLPDDNKLLEAFGAKYPVKPEITEERLEKIHNVVCRVQGSKAADECIEKIKERGYINFALRYFGLHYVADEMVSANEEYIGSIEKAGFKFFKPYRLKGN